MSPAEPARRAARGKVRSKDSALGGTSNSVDDAMIAGWQCLVNEVHRSRAQLARDIKSGRFPAPIELGPNRVAWYRKEVESWKASRPRRQYPMQTQIPDTAKT